MTIQYADAECFALATEILDLSVRVMNSCKRNDLSLADKLAIKNAANILNVQARNLLAIKE